MSLGDYRIAAWLAEAETGMFDVVIVHKPDRFARNLRVTLETLDRLEKAGVGFVSISENMDFSTPMGRMVLSTMDAAVETTRQDGAESPSLTVLLLG